MCPLVSWFSTLTSVDPLCALINHCIASRFFLSRLRVFLSFHLFVLVCEQRATIAMELVLNGSTMFFDEPTSGLDSATSFTVMNALRQVCHSRYNRRNQPGGSFALSTPERLSGWFSSVQITRGWLLD